MSSNSSLRGWVPIIAAVLVIIAVVWFGFSHLSKQMLRSEIPHPPEMARATPQLRQQVQESYENALSSPKSGEAIGHLAKVYHANNMFERARVSYGLAMRVDKNNPIHPYLRGVLEMTTGENERAITFLERAADLDPQYPHVWARLGQIHFRRSEYREAEQDFTRALALDPTHPHAGVGMARVLGRKAEWEEAAKTLEPCVQAHPGFGPGHRMLALVYQELGRSEEQKRHEDLGSDIGLQMNDPRTHDLYQLSSTASVLVTQAQIANSWGDLDRALALLERAVEVAPRDKDARLAIGRFLARPGIATPVRLAEARRHLETGLRIDSTYVNTRHDYAVVLQALGDTAAAADQWERILREEPEHAMAWMSLGELRLAREDYQGARDFYLKGLAVPPDTPFSLGDPGGGYRRLALTYWRTGPARKAFEAFEQSAAISPRVPDTYIDWARFLREKNRAETGVAVYEQGLDRIPDDPKLRLGYGNYLIQLGRYDSARVQLLASLRLQPVNVPALSAIGLVSLKTGDSNGAIRNFEAALRLNPAYLLAHYHLGRALMETGRREEAIQQFETALQLRPNFAPAKRALEAARSN